MLGLGLFFGLPGAALAIVIGYEGFANAPEQPTSKLYNSPTTGQLATQSALTIATGTLFGTAYRAMFPKPPIVGRNPLANVSESEIDAAVKEVTGPVRYYRTPVAASEEPGRTSLGDLVPVSRWGRPGLRPGDWVMRGNPTRLNYFLSFKWDPTQEIAAPSSGQAFMVPRLSIKSPGLWEMTKGGQEWPTGWIKGLFAQKKYVP
jgi:hypothetical protein